MICKCLIYKYINMSIVGYLMQKIILASASEGRKELFEQYFGNKFQIQATGVDEEDLIYLPPSEMVIQLAQRKSNSLHSLFYDDFICAFDTTVVCEQQNLGKPTDLQEAREMLRFLNKKTQIVWSGYSLEYQEFKIQGAEYSELVLSISDEEIEQYIIKHPVTKFAGAYAIQKQDARITILSGNIDTIIGAPMKKVQEFISYYSSL